jgi:hypothetical protein
MVKKSKKEKNSNVFQRYIQEKDDNEESSEEELEEDNNEEEEIDNWKSELESSVEMLCEPKRKAAVKRVGALKTLKKIFMSRECADYISENIKVLLPGILESYKKDEEGEMFLASEVIQIMSFSLDVESVESSKKYY